MWDCSFCFELFLVYADVANFVLTFELYWCLFDWSSWNLGFCCFSFWNLFRSKDLNFFASYLIVLINLGMIIDWW